MDNNKKNVPEIRFPGFTDPWEQRKLAEVTDVRDGTHDSPSYLSEGHPFVTSKNVKDGSINYDDIQYISDEDYEAINKRSKVDVNDILMGMIGTIGNLALIRIEPDFAIKNVALIKDTKQISYLYLYHYLQSHNTEKQLLSGLDGGTQKFVSLKKIRELNIAMPSEPEQLIIGEFFEALENLITLHQRKCDELKIYKKGLLQQMFPQPGESIPRVRFPGFTDPWEQRKLSDCCGQLSKTLNPQDTPNESFAEYSMPAFDNGEVPDIVAGNTMNSARKILDRPCLLINKLNVRKKRIWNVEKPEKNAVSSAEFVPVYSDEINLSFLKYIVLCDSFTAYLEDCSSGSSNSQKRVTPDVIMSASFLFPAKDEQDRIGEYFANLDNLITLHQRKCDELKTYKKGLLQKMFV